MTKAANSKACKKCGESFTEKPSHSVTQWIAQKYCSRTCMQTHVTVNCARCGKKFITYPSLISEGRGKYCSRACAQTQFKAGPEVNHPRWKGDEAGYSALHIWVRKHRGRPRQCEDCGTTTAKRYEWANISKEYKRDLGDWKRLCVSCHLVFDDHNLKVAATWKEKGYVR